MPRAWAATVRDRRVQLHSAAPRPALTPPLTLTHVLTAPTLEPIQTRLYTGSVNTAGPPVLTEAQVDSRGPHVT